MQRAETVLAQPDAGGRLDALGACATAGAPTGASVLVSSHDRNAAIFTFRGANTLLEEADLRSEAFAADVVYVSSLSNELADAFPAIVERRQGAGRAGGDQPARAPAVLARRRLPGDAGADRHPGGQPLGSRRAGAGSRRPLRRRRREGSAARPGETLPRLAARGFVGGGHEMGMVDFFAALRKLGPRYVVVTDGRHGAFLGTPEAILYCPVLETKVAGTAGAGDAFNATFTACVAMGRTRGGGAARGRHQRGLGRRPCRHPDRPAVPPGDRAGPRETKDTLARAQMVALARGVREIPDCIGTTPLQMQRLARERDGQAAAAVLADPDRVGAVHRHRRHAAGRGPDARCGHGPRAASAQLLDRRGARPWRRGARSSPAGASRMRTGCSRRSSSSPRASTAPSCAASAAALSTPWRQPIPADVIAGDEQDQSYCLRHPGGAEGKRRRRPLPQRAARPAGAGDRAGGHRRRLVLRAGPAPGTQGAGGRAQRLFEGHRARDADRAAALQGAPAGDGRRRCRRRVGLPGRGAARWLWAEGGGRAFRQAIADFDGAADVRAWLGALAKRFEPQPAQPLRASGDARRQSPILREGAAGRSGRSKTPAPSGASTGSTRSEVPRDADLDRVGGDVGGVWVYEANRIVGDAGLIAIPAAEIEMQVFDLDADGRRKCSTPPPATQPENPSAPCVTNPGLAGSAAPRH